MTKEEIFNLIEGILIFDGPDRHTDGADVIAEFIDALLAGNGEEWAEKYKARHANIPWGPWP